MKVFSQLVSAQFENRTSDYAAGTGKFWIRTDTSPVVSRFYDGSAVRTIVTTDNTQTLTNKTLTSPAVTGLTGTISASTDIDLGTASNTSRLTIAKDTLANISALTRKEGTVWYASDTDKLYKDDGTSLTEIGSGSGGAINYIGNPDAESGTTGWSTYDDGAAAPVDGTGGTVTTTLTRTTSSPLRGTGSFLITTTAANLIGEGVAYDFTISNADLAKIINISFDYSIASGTFATGDFTVYLIQDPSGTPVVVQPAPYQIQNLAVGLPGKFTTVFQTSSTVTSYRLCIHRAVSTSSAMTMKIDNVVVGPQVVNYGAPIGDWTAFTMTVTGTSSNPTKGTTATDAAYYRRVGDSIQIRWDYRQTVAGSAGSGGYLLALPSGIAIDTTKVSALASAVGQYTTVGRGFWSTVSNGIGTGGTSDVNVAVYDSTHLILYFTNISGTALQDNKTVVGSAAFGFDNTNVVASINAVMPVSGWSSTVLMSNDTDTRVVAMRASGDAASASSGDPVIFPTASYDTHGAYNTTTGFYTVPVSGYYRVHGLIVSANAAVALNIAVNGTTVIQAGLTDANGDCSYTGTVSVTAGQTISLEPGGTLDASSTSTMHIERISGPSTIAATETIAASYYGNTNFTCNTTTPADFNTKVYDTHNAVTTGSSWKFTAPVAGKYHVSFGISTSPASTGTIRPFVIYKNGSAAIYIASGDAATSTVISGSHTISLVAGDYIDVRATSNTSYGGGTVGTSAASTISIERIGI